MTVADVATCQHLEAANPRLKGFCVRCGRKIPEPIRRDREWEAQATREMTRGLALDPEPLIAFATRRADSAQQEYGCDFPNLDRDLGLETADELADARNYVVWWLDAIRRDLAEGGDRVVHLQRALRHIALAFDEVRSAR